MKHGTRKIQSESEKENGIKIEDTHLLLTAILASLSAVLVSKQRRILNSIVNECCSWVIFVNECLGLWWCWRRRWWWRWVRMINIDDDDDDDGGGGSAFSIYPNSRLSASAAVMLIIIWRSVPCAYECHPSLIACWSGVGTGRRYVFSVGWVRQKRECP